MSRDPKDALRSHLTELQADLEEAGDVEPEVQADVARLLEEVHGLLDRLPEGAEHHASVAEQLHDMVLALERDSPRLARGLNYVAHLLSSSGI